MYKHKALRRKLQDLFLEHGRKYNVRGLYRLGLLTNEEYRLYCAEARKTRWPKSSTGGKWAKRHYWHVERRRPEEKANRWRSEVDRKLS